MTLNYTTHARQQMSARDISEADCEASVINDPNPWQTMLKDGNHYRCFYNNVTVITDKSKTLVVTAFKGNPGGWEPQNEGL